jgi:hypothetical protein
MSGDLIGGTEGSVGVKLTDVATEYTAVADIESWESTIKAEITSRTFFGSTAPKKTITSIPLEGSIDGAIAKGRDAGKTKLVLAAVGGVRVFMQLKSDDGYIIEGRFILSEVKIGHATKDGTAFSAKFENDGDYTVEEDTP